MFVMTYRGSEGRTGRRCRPAAPRRRPRTRRSRGCWGGRGSRHPWPGAAGVWAPPPWVWRPLGPASRSFWAWNTTARSLHWLATPYRHHSTRGTARARPGLRFGKGARCWAAGALRDSAGHLPSPGPRSLRSGLGAACHVLSLSLSTSLHLSLHLLSHLPACVAPRYNQCLVANTCCYCNRSTILCQCALGETDAKAMRELWGLFVNNLSRE